MLSNIEPPSFVVSKKFLYSWIFKNTIVMVIKDKAVALDIGTDRYLNCMYLSLTIYYFSGPSSY